MWEMAKTAIVGFLTGKLFAHPSKAYGLLALGIALTAVLFGVLARLGLPLVAAGAVAAFLGGVLQPRLFKNLKYR